MANFDEFKQRAKEAAGTIADVSLELYKIAEEKAKILAKTTRLNAEIVRERTNIRKLYNEIGKTYYKLHKDDPEADLAQSCTEVTASVEHIIANKAAIEDLKQSGIVTDADIEVEIVADEDDAAEE